MSPGFTLSKQSHGRLSAKIDGLISGDVSHAFGHGDVVKSTSSVIGAGRDEAN